MMVSGNYVVNMQSDRISTALDLRKSFKVVRRGRKAGTIQRRQLGMI